MDPKLNQTLSPRTGTLQSDITEPTDLSPRKHTNNLNPKCPQQPSSLTPQVQTIRKVLKRVRQKQTGIKQRQRCSQTILKSSDPQQNCEASGLNQQIVHLQVNHRLENKTSRSKYTKNEQNCDQIFDRGCFEPKDQPIHSMDQVKHLIKGQQYCQKPINDQVSVHSESLENNQSSKEKQKESKNSLNTLQELVKMFTQSQVVKAIKEGLEWSTKPLQRKILLVNKEAGTIKMYFFQKNPLIKQKVLNNDFRCGNCQASFGRKSGTMYVKHCLSQCGFYNQRSNFILKVVKSFQIVALPNNSASNSQRVHEKNESIGQAMEKAEVQNIDQFQKVSQIPNGDVINNNINSSDLALSQSIKGAKRRGRPKISPNSTQVKAHWKRRDTQKQAKDKQQVPSSIITCQCGFQVRINQKGSFLNHIALKHYNMIPAGSSHVIVRNGVRLTALDVNEVHNDDKEYNCICKPHRKMSYAEFVFHIQKRHGGCTPNQMPRQRSQQ